MVGARVWHNFWHRVIFGRLRLSLTGLSKMHRLRFVDVPRGCVAWTLQLAHKLFLVRIRTALVLVPLKKSPILMLYGRDSDHLITRCLQLCTTTWLGI